MSEASNGLRQALARSASGTVVALGEMAATDILASLNDEQKAGLLAQLGAAPAPAPAPGANASDMEPDGNAPGEPGEDEKCSKCSEPMKDGKCQKCAPDSSASAAATDPVAQARAEERARYTAVMSSEHYAGREALAAKMLANDKLSADDIVGMLAAAAPSAAGDEGDAAAGAAMLAAMKSLGNPDTSHAGGGKPKAEANHGWDNIHAEIRERRGR
ncbi:hypothetical protein [Novosphingobium sp.]|uniref:hypothetical protein n=1 Tax=Novosphingobium sp. TaxID=1874826 RepID=UPI002FDCE07F